MNIKSVFKQFRSIVLLSREFSSIGSFLSHFGLFPIRVSLIRKTPRFLNERTSFQSKGGSISHYYPILRDYVDLAGTASGHYFHQDLLVSQYIYEKNPNKHIDVGSRIDGFVAHVASFREIEVLDIRPLSNSEHPNIIYRQADLMSDVEFETTDSLSCLHAIEHFGLGRYGDPIDPKGYLAGFKNLVRMVKPGGTLYISFPIGSQNEVHFNAHRVFHPADIFSWGVSELKLLSFDYVDDQGSLHKNHDLTSGIPLLTYGCGIYTFVKN
jgi:hypothetical protein